MDLLSVLMTAAILLPLGAGFGLLLRPIEEKHRRNTFTLLVCGAASVHPELLNCRNCVLNLDTLEPLPHDPDLLLSKVTGCDYDPDADRSEVEKFLAEIMQDDREKIAYLKRILGYSLTDGNPQEKMFIFLGTTTRNGKSTLCDTFEKLLGGYAENIEPESLAHRDSHHGSSGPSEDIARLKGARFIHCGEPPKHMVFNAALVKHLTGGDKVTARRLHENSFEFHPGFKLIMNTNYLPSVLDDTVFSSGRMQVLTFDRHFSEWEQDKHLKQRLQEPENLSALLAAAIDGLRDFRLHNECLDPPACVTSETALYRKDADKPGMFLDDCTECDDRSVVSLKTLYLVYAAWCRACGFGVDNKRTFSGELRRKGLLQADAYLNGEHQKNVISGRHITNEAFCRYGS